MKLYNYWRSSSSWRVRLALELKGIAYEYVAVNLRAGEQHQGGYAALNPAHTVPMLEWVEGGAVRRVAQSVAIVEYLEETHPSPPLLPKEPFARAQVRELVELVNSGIQPYQNLQVLGRVKHELRGDEQAWAAHFISQGLGALEALVAERGGRFCAGEALTLAEVYLIPQLYGARRFGVDVAKFPALLRVEAACAALPAFQRAHADAQPDAVKETK